MRFRAALVGLLVVASVGVGLLAGGRPDDPVARRTLRDFDTTWRAFDRRYPYFGLKGVDWDAVRDSLRPRAAAARSDADRLAVLTALLAPLRDVHAVLVSPDGTVHRPWTPARAPNWDADRWLAEMARHEWHPRGPAWGWARMGRVGYLAISSWDPGQLSAGAVGEVLRTFRGADALVVDVRMNAGGDDALARAVAGRFTDRAVEAGTVRGRSGGRGDLGAPLRRWVRPTPYGAWTRPVVVLTGRGSLSSTETFVGALAPLPHVTVVGDTTGGSSGHPVDRRLSDGWVVRVPRWAAYTPDGGRIEDRGIAPDRVIRDDGSVPPDRDPVIAAALALLGERVTRRE